MGWKGKARTIPPQVKDYMESNHTFQLIRGMGEGSQKFGEPKVMSGLKAHRLNKKFELDFLKSKDPQARLWRWVLADRDKGVDISRKWRSVASINAPIVLQDEIDK